MEKVRLSPWLTGIAYTLAMTISCSLLLAALLQWSSLSESLLPLSTIVINGIGLLVGGLVAGKRSSEKGWLNGCITGTGYAILMALIGFLAFDFSIQLYTLAFFIMAFAISTLGGMIGVSLHS